MISGMILVRDLDARSSKIYVSENLDKQGCKLPCLNDNLPIEYRSFTIVLFKNENSLLDFGLSQANQK